MEKQHLLNTPHSTPKPAVTRQSRVKLQLFLILAWATCLAYFWWSNASWAPWTSPSEHQRGSHNKTFSWETAPALPYLKYEKCYGGDFQCARLELPMDYWNGTTNETIGLAVIRRPAVVPVTDPRYGGAVLLNPGGPGGSGVFFALSTAEEISRVVDSKDGKFFDIVSFDARGVGLSTPQMRCLEDLEEELSWMTRRNEEGILGSSDASFGRLWSMTEAYAGSCSLPPEDERADIKKYMTTASVARDMVSLIEAHGEWREQEAARLLGKGCACQAAKKSGQPCDDVPESLRYIKGEESIQYWGFSYGTYLGLTYAAMFPDKIHRLVVDGVVDAYDYRQTLWYDNLFSTEQDLGLFYYHCARVGYPACPLANETGETTEAGVKARFVNITQSLLHNPLPIIERNHPQVITYSDVKSLVFVSLYSPLRMFPIVADLLAAIEKGNASDFSFFLRTIKSAAGLPQDATMAIACSDGEDQSWLDKPLFEEHLKNLTKLSPSVGPIWAEIRLACIHYDVRPYHRFTAPWEAETSHPILLMGNTADPVTPLRSAKKMSEGFKNAVVLTQDSPGHCTNAAPSKCTVGYVRKYFQTVRRLILVWTAETMNADTLRVGRAPSKRQDLCSGRASVWSCAW